MRRKGGYKGYHAAYDRLLLADARPLDSVSASVLRPGVHDVVVVEEELLGDDRAKYTFRGRAGRTIRKTYGAGAFDFEQAVRIRVELRGDADLLVCADGSIAVVVSGQAPRTFADLAAAEGWLRSVGAKRRRPYVAEILV